MHPKEGLTKGKQAIKIDQPRRTKDTEEHEPPLPWEPPDTGWVKLNVDGSFVEHTGEAGAGMILRDETNQVIFSACRQLLHCSGALESELAAAREGLLLALQWSSKPIILEMDSSQALSAIVNTGTCRSSLAYLVSEVKALIADGREIIVGKVNRSQNKASHSLAAFGRCNALTMCWLGSVPDDIRDVILEDLPVSY